jgi:hypothetical protein
MSGQMVIASPHLAASHSSRMASRTLLSVTSSVQPAWQGDSEEGTCRAHWAVAPAVQVLAPISTAAYSLANLSQSPVPPSTGQPPAPLVPPVA